MHSKKLLSLALSLLLAESVVAGPCKPRTTTAAISESTTIIPSVSSTTETSQTTIETSTAAETSETETETETETATTLLTSTTVTSAVDTTTTEEGTTTADETTTAVGETTTTAAETTGTTETGTTTAEALTTTTSEAETTTADATTTATSEAETTTADATTTTAAEPACAQTILLANPTPIYTSDNTYDDQYKSVTPPFPIGVFGVSSTNIYVSTNGVVSLNDGAYTYSNIELPAENLPSIAILPYWDDLIVRTGACNTGIWYDVYETDRGNTFTIEWQLGSIGFGAATGEHFSASFYEDYPGLVRFEYYETTKHGSSATVGVQNGQDFSQYSVNQDNSVPNQFFVEIDTSSGVGVIDSDPL
ncbi:hypothetical protein F25303_2223 [Fusarium sp. NRRL 25303]|nr:hypothetical protein F25303_2223 [Fusarium sp. NRRL 25303]